MRGLDRGESYVVTRNGVPVGELRPVGRSEFTSREALREVFRGAPAVDWAALKHDVREWFADDGDESDPWERAEHRSRKRAEDAGKTSK